ncbi:MAG TPA: DUF6356 family protein [Gammaproteobacteria bacterium]|nr:DUF6356 family protein [Gammaproteobacteria bacterium]
MENPFTQHPHSMNETYVGHAITAGGFGLSMMVAGFACVVHAIFPFLFKKTASNMLIKQMHCFIERMPVLEDRVLSISNLMDEKRGVSSSARMPLSTSMMQMQYESSTD